MSLSAASAIMRASNSVAVEPDATVLPSAMTFQWKPRGTVALISIVGLVIGFALLLDGLLRLGRV